MSNYINQGGWSIGNTDNITESSLELLVHLMGGQR